MRTDQCGWVKTHAATKAFAFLNCEARVRPKVRSWAVSFPTCFGLLLVWAAVVNFSEIWQVGIYMFSARCDMCVAVTWGPALALPCHVSKHARRTQTGTEVFVRKRWSTCLWYILEPSLGRVRPLGGKVSTPTNDLATGWQVTWAVLMGWFGRDWETLPSEPGYLMGIMSNPHLHTLVVLFIMSAPSSSHPPGIQSFCEASRWFLQRGM